MAEPPSKALILIEALEELSRKETVCLREESYEAMLRVQNKKAELVRGLEALRHASRTSGERRELNRRIEALREQEQANAELLASRMSENRELFRKLESSAKSASSLLKAYGKPDAAEREASGLERKA